MVRVQQHFRGAESVRGVHLALCRSCGNADEGLAKIADLQMRTRYIRKADLQYRYVVGHVDSVLRDVTVEGGEGIVTV